MQTLSEILEVRAESCVIARPEGLELSAGQYLLGGFFGDALPSTLFPSHLTPDAIHIAGPFPAHWRAGQSLGLRAPLGKGFRLPPTIRRVAVAALDSSPARLLPLVALALAQGAEVCLYTSTLPAGLPEAVEVLPPNELREAWNWADFIALDCPLESRARLEEILPRPRPYPLPCPAQVLVHTQMPCGGLAECGVCAVETARGWLHACKDGPVFDLEQVV